MNREGTTTTAPPAHQEAKIKSKQAQSETGERAEGRAALHPAVVLCLTLLLRASGLHGAVRWVAHVGTEQRTEDKQATRDGWTRSHGRRHQKRSGAALGEQQQGASNGSARVRGSGGSCTFMSALPSYVVGVVWGT
jgi:hypothetical protein